MRLSQGDYRRETEYDEDPVDAASRWQSQGARWLHVVDLDGARAGHPVNTDTVRRILAAVSIPIQLGGGLRDSTAVEEALRAGVERAVLGTAALRDPSLVEALVAAHGDRLVASVDARGGRVAAEGWTEESDVLPEGLVGMLGGLGVARFVFTPVEVDGTMEGPGIEQLRRVAEAAPSSGLIYSGGVGSLQHLEQLVALDLPTLEGVIVGRALYEGRFSVAEGNQALSAT